MASFIDSKILVYAEASDDPTRQAQALQLLRELKRSGEGVISTQVLQEYCNVALRKLRLDSGCVTLYSEDLNTGDVIHGVTLINPFSR